MDAEPMDAGTLSEVPPEERLDVDEGPDAHATEGGLDDDLDDLYDDPGTILDLVDLLEEIGRGERGPVGDRGGGAGPPPGPGGDRGGGPGGDRGGGPDRGGSSLCWAAPYQGANNCTGIAAGGSRALLAWALEDYATPAGAFSFGIYNCRTVRGGSTTSLHGEGRAVDVGLPLGSDAKGNPVGHEMVERLGRFGDVLGIQCVIFDRRIWSAVSPGGRPYNGVHPHYDHLHIELTWPAADKLTLSTFRQHLGNASATTSDSTTGSGPSEEDTMFCAEGDVNETVQYWQRLLHTLGYYSGKLDSDFGPKTKKAVADASYASTDGARIGPAEAAGIHKRIGRINS